MQTLPLRTKAKKVSRHGIIKTALRPKLLPPSKYYEGLEPWFRLANSLSREPQARKTEVCRFVKEYLLPRAQGASPDKLFPSKLNYSFGERLAVQVHVILWFLVRGEPWHFRETREGSDTTIAAAGIGRDGLVETGVFNPLQLFLGELKGTPVDRIRACEVCDTLFFAVRKDRKCCSGECNHVRQVHRSQGNWPQYRENRKFRNKTGLPAVKGKERRALIERWEAVVEAKGSEVAIDAATESKRVASPPERAARERRSEGEPSL